MYIIKLLSGFDDIYMLNFALFGLSQI